MTHGGVPHGTARLAFLLVLVLLPLLTCGEEEAEEAVVVQKATNEGISIMLLGSVSFMMGLFYLVNQQDADMAKYSWQVISDTISIFSAVLLFQAVDSIVEIMLARAGMEGLGTVIGFVNFFCWFAGLQFVLAHFSYAVHPCKAELVKDKEVVETCELKLRSYAILLGHIAGFAAINAFGEFQQEVPHTVLCTFTVAPIAWITVFLISQVMDKLRDHFVLSDDRSVDKFEKLWDEATEETEDDIIGLAVSFLVTQSLRLWIGGALPNAEGEEEGGGSGHTNEQALKLLLIGIVLVVLEFVRMIFFKKSFGRLTSQMRNIVMMCLSWCIFFSFDWWLSHNFFTTNHGMQKEVVLALMVTATAMSMIFLLDKLADMPMTGKQVDKAIRSVVRAYGILIGFSWEKAFDTAVAEVSDWVQVLPESLTKSGLAVLLVLLVVPAWRWHILPTILKFEKMEEEEEKITEEGWAGERTQAVQDGNPLKKPLLRSMTSEKTKPKPLSVQEAVQLQKKVRALEEDKRSLEEHNTDLEKSLKSLMEELNDLQRMAKLMSRDC